MIASKAPKRKKLDALFMALPNGLASLLGVSMSSPGFFID